MQPFILYMKIAEKVCQIFFPPHGEERCENMVKRIRSVLQYYIQKLMKASSKGNFSDLDPEEGEIMS